MLIAACVPTVQKARSQLDGFEGPRFDVAAHRFHTFDGAELGLSAWTPPDDQEPWAVVVGLHGMNDYGQAFYLAGPWFAERGVALFAYDARGFGRSPSRGVWGGERLMTEDVYTAVRLARQRYPNAKVAVIGDSMGAATAIAAFGHPEAPPIDRLVLVAPAVWGWSTMPEAYALTLWAGAHTFPWRAVSQPRSVRITPSDNNEMLRMLGRDPNMIFATRIDALYGLVNLMETAADRAGNLDDDLDIAFLYGARDEIIPRPSAYQAARRLPAHARTAVYANGYHMLLRDLQREVVYQDILTFLQDPRAPFPSQAPPFRPALQANR
jgi:acylglycerol lipase